MKVNTLLHSLFFLLLSASLLFSVVSAQSAGGSSIVNSANAVYSILGSDRVGASNEVTASIPSICGLVITPNGSVDAPASSVRAEPGDSLFFPYVISNTGNITSSFDLSLVVDASSSLSFDSLTLYLDSNNNEQLDNGEAEVSSVSLAVGESANLLVALSLSSSYELAGRLYFNVVGACSADTTITDDDNVTEVFILEGGVSSFEKSSTPATGTPLAAGDSVSYSVELEVAERTLSNVVVTDALDSDLEAPTAFSVSLNGALVDDAASYDALSHTVTARFATLAPSDKLVLSISSVLKEDTLATALIDNQAELRFDGGSGVTNKVTHPVLGFCAVIVNPNGNTSTPAHDRPVVLKDASPLLFAYTLTNPANQENLYDLATLILPEGNLVADEIFVVQDKNENGAVDADEPSITSLSVAALESVALLLVIDLPNESAGDVLYANLVATCSTEPAIKDDDNVARVSLLVTGLDTPSKSANPPSETPVFPGATIAYSISFQVRDVPLQNVTVSDVLSEFLEAPTNIASGTITDSASGLSAQATATYDAVSKELVWTFASIPAGMNVTLTFSADVRKDLVVDAEVETVVINTAKVTFEDGEEDTNTISNPTRHEVRPLLIQLEKSASPERIKVGEALSYSLKIINPRDSVYVDSLELSDDLPEQVRYRPGTSVVTFPDGSSKSLEPTVEGQLLTWTLNDLDIDEIILVTFDVTVLAKALDVEEIINTAGVVASDALGRATADAAASAATVIDGGFFRVPSVLMGTVFVDSNDNDVFDASDLPVEGVRLYLSDGRAIISDANGRYTFLDVLPGLEVLKVDQETLPGRLLKETNDERNEGFWRIRLEPGQISRQDVPLLPPGARLAVTQVLNVFRGPVSVVKQISQDNESGLISVRLIVRSSEALKDLRISDPSAMSTGLNNTTIMDNVFALGNVEAGFETTIDFQFSGDLEASMVLPEITWSVR